MSRKANKKAMKAKAVLIKKKMRVVENSDSDWSDVEIEEVKDEEVKIEESNE